MSLINYIQKFFQFQCHWLFPPNHICYFNHHTRTPYSRSIDQPGKSYSKLLTSIRHVEQNHFQGIYTSAR